jgi:iron complex transport system permease protein
MFKGDNIKGTLLDTALFGGIFVLICDMIGRVLIAPYELPIELIVGIVGSIIFVALLFYRLKNGRRSIRLKPSGSGCNTAPVMQGGQCE